MSAASLYERIAAACCEHHGFALDATLEYHIRAIVMRVLEVRGQV